MPVHSRSPVRDPCAGDISASRACPEITRRGETLRPIDYFDTAADMYRARPAVQNTDGTMISFDELRALSGRIAAALRARLEWRDAAPIGIYSPNDWRVIACTLGIMRAGATVVPLHAKAHVEQNARYVEQLQPVCLFYHSSLEEGIGQIRARLPTSALLVCLDGNGADVSLEQLLRVDAGYVDDWSDAYGNVSRPVYIRQTSGTTGEPKVIVGDIASFDATQVVLRQRLHHEECEPVCLVAAPLSHAAGVHAFAAMTIGASLVIMRDFDPVEMLRNIQRFRVTHMWLPASALYLLLSCPDLERFEYSSLRSIVLGASATSPAILREAVVTFGPCVSVNYSQIESGFLSWLDAKTVALAVAGHHAGRLRSSGQSVYASRIAIMDEEGLLLRDGESGEIVVRGPSVKPYILKPYETDVVETATAQRYGWHHTGDIGYFDDEGYLYVTGRKKDLIISAGFKISAADVERVIMEMSEVAECAVIGIPDEVRGESVKAIVTVKTGKTVTAKMIVSHCRARLGRLQAPSSVEQWDELPRSAVGKIDKRRIRERFGSVASTVTAE